MHVLFVLPFLTVLFIYDVIRSVFLFLTPKRFRKKKDITGQKVLITGAGSGLGRQLAVEFSKRSISLVLLDIDKKALVETRNLLQAKSVVSIYECDITNRIMVYAVGERIKDDVGSIDIIINNAGVVNGKSLIDLSDESIVRTLEVNTISHFWICKCFLPHMMARNSGHIVTISSLAGLFGLPKLTDFCASKSAAIAFSESLSAEMFAKNLDGIKFTVACPTIFNLGLFKEMVHRFTPALTPEYVAQQIVEAVLREQDFVYIPCIGGFFALMKAFTSSCFYHTFLRISGDLQSVENFSGRINDGLRAS